MVCPSCGLRKGRRACPALGGDICTMCCGTKRLTEIRCPTDCAYLAAAREHPSSADVKRERENLAVIGLALRDLSEAQVDLFVALNLTIGAYQGGELQPLLDADVVEAASAVAATYETAARGVIYEHRPGSVPAARLARELKAIVDKAAGSRGSKRERDAALVLRRIADAARPAIPPTTGPGSPTPNPRRYITLVQATLPPLTGSNPVPADKRSGSLIELP